MFSAEQKFLKIRCFQAFCLILVIIFTGVVFAESSAPLKRIIFKKKMQIVDGGEKTYFKYPKRVYADLDGHVYILDADRVLRFNPEGKFTKSMVEWGQGPSEVTNVSYIDITDKHIIIHNNNPGKIVRFDKSGNYVGEFRLNSSESMNFSHFYNDTYFFSQSRVPIIKGSEKYMDVDYHILGFGLDGKKKKKYHTFPVYEYILRNKGTYGSFSISELLTAHIGQRYLVVACRPKYKIEILDLKGTKISTRINRDFKRNEIPKELSARFNIGMASLNGKLFRKPVQAFFNDIQALFVHNEIIWVVTSDMGVEKGVRIDRFTAAGKQKDSFYLRLEGQRDIYAFKWAFAGKYLYVLDAPEEGATNVFKYDATL